MVTMRLIAAGAESIDDSVLSAEDDTETARDRASSRASDTLENQAWNYAKDTESECQAETIALQQVERQKRDDALEDEFRKKENNRVEREAAEHELAEREAAERESAEREAAERESAERESAERATSVAKMLTIPIKPPPPPPNVSEITTKLLPHKLDSNTPQIEPKRRHLIEHTLSCSPSVRHLLSVRVNDFTEALQDLLKLGQWESGHHFFSTSQFARLHVRLIVLYK
jgi:hypothetical protein